MKRSRQFTKCTQLGEGWLWGSGSDLSLSESKGTIPSTRTYTTKTCLILDVISAGEEKGNIENSESRAGSSFLRFFFFKNLRILLKGKSQWSRKDQRYKEGHIVQAAWFQRNGEETGRPVFFSSRTFNSYYLKKYDSCPLFLKCSHLTVVCKSFAGFFLSGFFPLILLFSHQMLLKYP